MSPIHKMCREEGIVGSTEKGTTRAVEGDSTVLVKDVHYQSQAVVVEGVESYFSLGGFSRFVVLGVVVAGQS